MQRRIRHTFLPTMLFSSILSRRYNGFLANKVIPYRYHNIFQPNKNTHHPSETNTVYCSTCNKIGQRYLSITSTLLNEKFPNKTKELAPLTQFTINRTLTDTTTTKNHEKTYIIKGRGEGSRVKVTTNTGHELRTDVPRKMGGHNTAPQPVEHLLAALSGCAQATATFVGRWMTPRLEIEAIEFELMASRDERGSLRRPIEELPDVPSRLQVVSGTARVFLKGERRISKAEMELLAEQTEARCPIANMMLASGCILDITWIDGSA